MPSPLNNPQELAVREEDEEDITVEREGDCRCGGEFTLESYVPVGETDRLNRLTHSLPTCPHFDRFDGLQYLAWNRQTGKLPN